MKEIPLFLYLPFKLFRKIFEERTATKSARKRSHSQVAPEERPTSSDGIRTDSGTPSKRMRADSSASSTTEQGASTSGQNRAPFHMKIIFKTGNLTENSGNLSPDGTTTSSLVTQNDQDPPSDIAPDENTSGQNQANFPMSISSQFGSVTENAGNLNSFPDASDMTATSSVVTQNDQDPPSDIAPDASTRGQNRAPFHMKIIFKTGNVTESSGNLSPDKTTISSLVTQNDQEPPSDVAPDESTSGQNQANFPMNISCDFGSVTENIENRNSSPAASDVRTTPPATDQDSPSGIAQDSGTSEEGQPTSPEDESQFQCSICLLGPFRKDQIKRLRCSHAFHQSCIDMWLHEHSHCPVCRTPYRRIRRHGRHTRPRRAGRRHRRRNRRHA